jgi:exonuclease III
MLHGQDFPVYGYTYQRHAFTRKAKTVARRFDHVLASVSLNAVSCQYLIELREQGLSDHSPIEVGFCQAVPKNQ